MKHSLDCEFGVLELHNSCRRHKQRLLRQYKKGKVRGAIETENTGNENKPKKKVMRKKTALQMKQPKRMNPMIDQQHLDELDAAGIDGVIDKGHRFVI